MRIKTNSEKDQLKYRPVEGYWDEALLTSGIPRRHWRKLVLEIRRMGFRHLSRRWQSGQQLIQSEGVTYNLGNLADGNEYFWPMDPIPLVINASEWSSIEQAVIQRATLFNAILTDLYGPQSLLHDGSLPPAIVLQTRISCGRVSESRPKAVCTCIRMRWTLPARRPGTGGLLLIGRRRRPVWGTRSRIVW